MHARAWQKRGSRVGSRGCGHGAAWLAGCALGLAFLLGGCSTVNVHAVKAPPEAFTSSLSAPNVQPTARDPGVYVFDEPPGVRVKVRNLALLSLIDEVAYRRGFNYRVLADLTPFQVDIFGPVGAALPGEQSSDWERTEQRRFASDRELFDAVVAQVNRVSLSGSRIRLGYRWVSDGPEFFLHDETDPREMRCSETSSADDHCDTAQVAFKKFFVRNVQVEEAAKNLRALFFRDDHPGAPPEPMINKDNWTNSTLTLYRPQNAIVMRSTDPGLIAKASQLLFALDASYQQVLVETLIFQYDENVAQRIGAVLDVKDEAPSSAGARNSTVQFQFGSAIADSLPRFFYELSDTEKRASLLLRLAVSDSEGFVRVLAEPRLVLQSGESASVTLNTNKHVLIPGVNTPGTIERIEAGITLKLTPTVLGNGKVRIALELSQSDFVNTSESNIVATSVQNKVVTSIVAQDSEMVSIGGIHSRRDSRSSSGLPGVRDLPGVGYLFGMRSADGSKSRIEFMIRPTVERAAQRLRTIRENVERTNDLLQRDLERDPRSERRSGRR